MSVQLERAFSFKLQAAYAALPGKLTALRLWQAAEHAFPEWFQDAMAMVRKEMPRRRVTAEHIDLLDRLLSREGDFFAAKMLGDTQSKFPRAKGMIDYFAELEDQSSDDLQSKWNAAANAFHDLAHATGVLPYYRFSARPKLLLNRCELCWRTAPRGANGTYYCSPHLPRPNNSSYKSLLLLSRWRSPTQDPDSATYFIYQRKREVGADAPSGLESDDNDNTAEFLDRIYLGEYAPIENFKDLPRDLSWYWPRLSHSERFLRRGKKVRNFEDAADVLSALDPIGSAHPELHQHVHAAMLRDQRLLIEMMQWCEAWLSAAAMRRKFIGGTREKWGR